MSLLIPAKMFFYFVDVQILIADQVNLKKKQETITCLSSRSSVYASGDSRVKEISKLPTVSELIYLDHCLTLVCLFVVFVFF